MNKLRELKPVELLKTCFLLLTTPIRLDSISSLALYHLQADKQRVAQHILPDR